MKVATFDELYVLCLQDLRSAEEQLIKALPKVAKIVTSDKLRKAVESHLEETKGHHERLLGLLKELGKKPDDTVCPAMKGLIKEADEIMMEVTEPLVRDAALIGAAQKCEHYEIASYGTAVRFAEILGKTQQAKTLHMTLDEEYNADSTLTDIAESEVNEQAAEMVKTAR